MNQIEKLVLELCPNGVAKVPLGSIVQIANRGVDKVENPDEEEVFLLNYMDVYSNREIGLDQVSSKTTATENKIRDCDLQVGDILITPTSETRDDLAHAAVVMTPMPKTVYSYHVMRLRIMNKEVTDSKFLAYQFRSSQVQSQILSASNGITRFGLTKPKWESLLIQLPPLKIQREIVRILDTFTELIAKLEAELKARTIQYELYRRELLTAGRNRGIHTSSTLGEVSLKVTSGSTPLADSDRYYENGTIPWLRTQEVKFNAIWETAIKVTDVALKETGVKWIPENCVIIAISGATAGRSAVNMIPLTTNQHCCNFQIDPGKANYRYVFHWVASHYEDIKSLGRGVRSDLSAGQLKQYPIYLPPLEQQKQIASVLDKFDQLTGDVKFGLPAEIAARRQQYEHYRNKLLTFRDLEVA